MTTLQAIPEDAKDKTPDVFPAHEMRIADKTGDLKINWDSTKQKEVDAAKEQFDAKIKDGWKAYSVKRSGVNKGKKGSEIKTFDPDAELLILVPPYVGG